MKEKPILFSAPMVKAILRGDKTQTRRIVKSIQKSDQHYGDIEQCDKYPNEFFQWQGGEKGRSFFCPYGDPGDQIWVRETFNYDGLSKSFVYKASWPNGPDGWKPSIHMPRKASRIDLLIKNIRVERLQDISEKDAREEGFPPPNPMDGGCFSAREEFKDIWQTINGHNSWFENPWVWVVEFERIRP